MAFGYSSDTGIQCTEGYSPDTGLQYLERYRPDTSIHSYFEKYSPDKCNSVLRNIEQIHVSILCMGIIVLGYTVDQIHVYSVLRDRVQIQVYSVPKDRVQLQVYMYTVQCTEG